jgi:ATP-dependent DNA helicase RecQ
MPAEERRAAQEEFSSERSDIVVATVAFGMGIDRSNVRFVLHAGMPKSIEHYQQEAGRAGRDGLAAECVLLYSGSDAQLWRTLLEKDDGEMERDPEFIASSLRHIADMQRYCSAHVCRHQSLVEYFGEPWTKERCESCDVCLEPQPLVDDSTIVAQKILSCIVRVREGFGAGHVIDVLRGHRTEKVTQRNHETLSTFGLMREFSKEALRSFLDQLIAAGCIGLSGVQYPTLFVTQRGRAVLRGEYDVALVTPEEKREARPKRVAAPAAEWADVDRALFERLRTWRREEAAERGVPPFVIFGDRTLREIAARAPKNRTELRAIHGVGDAKLEAFAQAILAIVEAG